jgi:hypothetical protein
MHLARERVQEPACIYTNIFNYLVESAIEVYKGVN